MIKKKIFSMVLLIVPCIIMGSSLVSAYETVIGSNYFWNIYDANEEFNVPNDTVFSNKVLSSSAWILQGGWMSVKPLILSNAKISTTTSNFYSRFIFYRDLNNELNYLCNSAYSSNNGRYDIYNYKFDYFSRFVWTGFTEHPANLVSMKNYWEKISVDSFYNDSQLKWSMTRYALWINQATYTRQSVICFIYDDLWFSICALWTCFDSTSSQVFATSTSIPDGANIDPVEFSTDIIWTSPRTSNIPTPTPTPNTPNTNIYCPTIWQLLKNYGENYNTWLCYNNTLYFNNETLQFETVEQEDIFTIFTDYTTFTNRQSIYNTNCWTPYTTNSCSNAFSGEYKKYSILSNMINAKVDEKKLWNYCNMALNYDLNATTCVASGVIAEPPTRDEFLDSIINWDYTVVTPNSWNIYDNLLTGDQTRETETQRDVFWAMDRIYTKITWLFRDRNGVQGIIPEYIMRICYISILFVVLFKKW